MVGVSFITPEALLLLLLLPALWALTFAAPRRLARWRTAASLALRSVILAALVGALAGAQITQPVRELTTVFLIDASDSVAPAQRERAVRYVDQALTDMPAGDLAAVVVFGENALVERAPSELGALTRISSVPVTTRTNLQDAIQLGLALFPAETQKRLVLISDGGENQGRAADAARLATVRGVPLDVVYLASESGPDVIVSALSAPSVAREGQDVAIGVRMRATFATGGALQIFVDGRLAGEQQVELTPGVNDVTVSIPAGSSGFRRIEVRLDAEGDAEPQNNRAAAFTEVQGPPRILLIAGERDRAENLRAALAAAGVRAEVTAPDAAPATLEQLSDYAGIVIVDTPARDMPRPLMQALPAYVRDLGRGLAMIGGVDSFGAGGYRRTPIETALPVQLDPRDTLQQPDLALTMVIDRSGSMDESAGIGGRTKLDLAKEAVYQASLGLSERDQVGLVVFDESADWVLPLQQLPSPVAIEQALSTFGPGGGTNIRSGVEQGARALIEADARIKHMILLTDGMAESNYSDLISQLAAAGVTISTVAIGADANPNLEAVATNGGGRFYRVTRVEEVPDIFLQETVIAAGRDIIEGEFVPQIGIPAPIVRGFNTMPPLLGLNGAEIKDTARAILLTPDGKPLLAQWQYGLGRSVAWTSDMQGRWARDWVTWDQFARFAGGLADLLLPPGGSRNLTLSAVTDGAQTVLDLEAEDQEGRPINDAALVGQIIDPLDQGAPLQFTQVGPGRYRAVVATSAPGVYLAQVAAAAPDGTQLGIATTGLVVSYSLEYGDRRDNLQLLRDLAAITGGRIDPPAEEAFAPMEQAVRSVREIGLPLLWIALLLWPLDIAVRRLMLRLSDISPELARLRARFFPASAAAPGPAESLARLSAAKQRAQARERPTLRTTDITPARERTAAAAPERQPATTEPPAADTRESGADKPVAADEQFARLLAAKQRARRRRDTDNG
jgi:Mg-chelatase subunit ChlD